MKPRFGLIFSTTSFSGEAAIIIMSSGCNLLASLGIGRKSQGASSLMFSSICGAFRWSLVRRRCLKVGEVESKEVVLLDMEERGELRFSELDGLCSSVSDNERGVCDASLADRKASA